MTWGPKWLPSAEIREGWWGGWALALAKSDSTKYSLDRRHDLRCTRSISLSYPSWLLLGEVSSTKTSRHFFGIDFIPFHLCLPNDKHLKIIITYFHIIYHIIYQYYISYYILIFYIILYTNIIYHITHWYINKGGGELQSVWSGLLVEDYPLTTTTPATLTTVTTVKA